MGPGSARLATVSSKLRDRAVKSMLGLEQKNKKTTTVNLKTDNM